jgi:general secretion pathway protein J
VNRRVRGFTLLEMLLALVLLAAGLALAFATVRAATTMVERGEIRAQRNERTRAVEGFLRQRIGTALPVVFATDPTTFRQSRFLGEARRIRFVADLPAYLGRGGPHLYDLSFDDQGRLMARFSIVQAGQAVDVPDGIAPELLADRLRLVRFRYRGLDERGQPGPWQDAWRTAEILPLQVAVDVETEAGARWPELIVTLVHSEGGAGGGAQPPGGV